MPAYDFEDRWSRYLGALTEAGRRRRLRPAQRAAEGQVEYGQGPLVDFSSNDYLGLSRHPLLISRARDYAQEWGAGTRASRLVTGNIAPFSMIEAKIAAGKASEAALVFVSGFQANATILPALLDRRALGAEPLVFCDKLNHASLIQGCQAAGVKQIRFRHNDLGHLDQLLAQHSRDDRPSFIVTETVFSMDGDCADVTGLTRLADKYQAFLYLDEAHATGVLGLDGFGLAKGSNRSLVMGTFSKALGGFGAYAACSAALRDFLVNRCAGLIYATALPPAVLGAMDAALDLIPQLDSQRRHLAKIAGDFRAALQAAGRDTGSSTTQIVPLILGPEQRALDLAKALEAEGLLAIAIRPPTVPAGQSRIRFTFCANHSDQQVDQLTQAVQRLAGPP